MFRSILRALAIALFAPWVLAAPCVGFTDVDDSSGFCTNVAWLKNRSITLGCTSATLYCPSDAVVRLGMAAFMNRLGTALTPKQLRVDAAPGAIDLDGNPVVCQTQDFLAEDFARIAYADVNFSGLASADVGLAAALVLSLDAGATWSNLNLTSSRGFVPANQWGTLTDLGFAALDIDQGARFGVRMSRFGPGAATDLTASRCQLRVLIYSQDETAAPVVKVSATVANASEVGPTHGQFVVSRSVGKPTPLSVLFTMGGSATNCFDYACIGSITILAGQTSVQVPVTVLQDLLNEGTEAAILTLTPHPGYVIGTPSAAVTIANGPAPTNLPPSANAGGDQTIALPASASLAGTASDDGQPNPPLTLTTTWSKFSGPGTVTFGNAGALSTSASFSAAGTYVLRLTANDSVLSAFDDVTIVVNPASALPPNPATVATPLAPGIVSDIGEDTEFLYTGPAPIQTGVVPGTIGRTRAAVLRGRVLNAVGAALSAVIVRVANHPEFGQTLSRADGGFDLAVNGGDFLTLDFTKAGFLPAQRQVRVPVRDWRVIDDVVLLAVDSKVTTITANAGAMQVHQGNPVNDADGSRTSTTLIPAGTTATLVMPNGSTQPIASLAMRATEYTVGTNGPRAMPAALPPTSGYTYAVELSADEAIAAGAASVQFSQPLANYVDNFLGFPVGMAVPTAFYDRVKTTWIAAPNGRVIKITAIAGGQATVDSVGTGSLPPLVLSTAELQQLGQLYTVGKELWRVPVTHFTPWDHNWPFGPPSDATAPLVPAPSGGNELDEGTCEAGSVIECENQTLGETIRLVGTKQSLHYRSARTPGRAAARTLRIFLSATTVPASLKRIELEIQIAGQRIKQSFGPGANQQALFTWDGNDPYGRALPGRQPVTVELGYVYDAVYRAPADFASSSFGLPGGALLSGNQARSEITVSRSFAAAIGPLDARLYGLGGWSLTSHHLYDPQDGRLHSGSGDRRGAESLGAIIRSVKVENPIGTPVSFNAQSAAVGPDGSLYLVGPGGPGANPVKRVMPNGLTVPFGTLTNVITLYGTGVGPDGSLYVTQEFVNSGQGNRISRIAPDGTTTIVAGQDNARGFSGDGGPALAATFERPRDVAIAADGSIYIVDGGNNRIRRIGPDGIVTTVAGNGAICPGPITAVCGDGGPATQAALDQPMSMIVAPDGTFYFFEFGTRRIRRVGPDGIISTHAGNGFACFADVPLPCGDGGPATQAALDVGGVSKLALGPDGAVYIIEHGINRVRVIGADGIIRPVAGRGGFLQVSFVEGMPARQAQLNLHNSGSVDVAVAADGKVYIAAGPTIREVVRTLPALAVTDSAVASEDGRELYVFDSRGQHLRTLHGLTGATLTEFAYDAAGRLVQVVEKTGGTDNVITIQRDTAGKPTAIVAPFGQQTALGVDANGFLSSVTNPAGQQTLLASTTEGLLTSFTDPRGKASTFLYDALGRLTRNTDAVGGFQALSQTATASQFTVTRTTAMSRTTSYKVETTPDAAVKRTIVAPDASQAIVEDSGDAGTEKQTWRDGTITNTTLSPDPRFGMAAPLPGTFAATLAGGPVVGLTSSQTITTSDPLNPFGFTSLTATTTIGSRTTTSTYTAATRREITTTPAGRSVSVDIDVLGRPIRSELVGLDAATYGYDSRGRLATITRGAGPTARTIILAYDPQGFVQTVTDPLGRTLQLGRDTAGRITSKTLPGGSVVGVGYDAAGNVTSVTPPGRPAHTFAYSDRNELALITPPVVAGTGPTSVAYNLDKQLATATRPDNRAVAHNYDAAGRPIARVFSSGGVTTGTDTLGYNAAGRLASIAAASGITTSFSFVGPLPASQTWSGAVTGSVSSTFDAHLQLASESVNGGNTIAFSYDADGLMTGAGALSITRHPQHGLETGTTLGGVTTSTAYNGFGEVSGHSASAGATPLYNASFVRDAAGRIAQKTETVAGVTDTFVYGYDPAGQITTVTKNGAISESYVYDTNGNRVSATVGGIGVAATYDSQDRLTVYGAETYTYSAAGELATKVAAGQQTTYQYDQVGNLANVALPGGTTIAYLPDGLDRRVARRVNGAANRGFLYSDRLRIVGELDASGALSSRFVYAGKATPAYLVKGGVAHRIITDHLGSVRLVINTATNAVVQRIDYDTFGNVVLDTNPGFQPFGFGGGLRDPDSGLIRFGARDYDPRVGRWAAKDPSGFRSGDTNLYRYARNDPVNLVDRAGRTAQEIDDEIEFLEEALRNFEQRLKPSSVQTDLQVEVVVDRQTARQIDAYTRRLKQLQAIKRLFGPGAQALVFVITCVGISERAEAAGRTTLEQIDEEGKRDFLETIHFYADPFVETVVDVVRGILPF